MYSIEEFPELWVDACLRSSDGKMMFLSVYGRDGSLMQFMSALELGAKHERGAERFHLVDAGIPAASMKAGQPQRHSVDVMGTERLTKVAAKLPRQTLFGQLSQMWLFDKALQAPDRANRIAWVLARPEHGGRATPNPRLASGATDTQDRIWRTVVDLSPVALLEHWREPVLNWLRTKGALSQLDDPVYPALGDVSAWRISLSDHFVAFISQEVRAGVLRAEDAQIALAMS